MSVNPVSNEDLLDLIIEDFLGTSFGSSEGYLALCGHCKPTNGCPVALGLLAFIMKASYGNAFYDAHVVNQHCYVKPFCGTNGPGLSIQMQL